MEAERIQAPEGIAKLMEELWLNHQSDCMQVPGRIFMIDLPEPTDEEKRIMASNRTTRKPEILDETELHNRLANASENLGGW